MFHPFRLVSPTDLRPDINMDDRHQHMVLPFVGSSNTSGPTQSPSTMSIFIIKQALSVQSSKVSKVLVYFRVSNLHRKKMLSPKKLINMAKRWQKFAAKQRKRISFQRNVSDADSFSTSASSLVEKGHFVLYTADQARFVIPLAYLENEVIRHLLSMSEEEFGLPRGGPIKLPCDSAITDYIISLIKKGVAAGDLHKALVLSIPSCCCSIVSPNQESTNQQLLVY